MPLSATMTSAISQVGFFYHLRQVFFRSFDRSKLRIMTPTCGIVLRYQSFFRSWAFLHDVSTVCIHSHIAGSRPDGLFKHTEISVTSIGSFAAISSRPIRRISQRGIFPVRVCTYPCIPAILSLRPKASVPVMTAVGWFRNISTCVLSPLLQVSRRSRTR